MRIKQQKVYDGFAKTEQPDDRWIEDADEIHCATSIWHLQPIQMGTYTWSVAGDITSKNPLDGIFAGANNIVTLNIGEKLIGVGNYAFYGCNGLNSISFEANSITVIGNWAFAGMRQYESSEHPQRV
ncbi:leucine-rich repeat protein [Waltera sp.]|uniref:leucine-rich repeat protein n=1 Tax=Waltera sp. TaxID=2815806 RepID=UPI0039A31F9B